MCDSLPNLSLILNGGVCGWVVIDMDDVDEEGVVGIGMEPLPPPFPAPPLPGAPVPLLCTGQCDKEARDELQDPFEQ